MIRLRSVQIALRYVFLLLLMSCSNLFYQPVKPHYVDPKQFKMTYEDVFFKSQDGTELHAWFFPAKNGKPKGTIVQFHGNAQNISTHFFSLYWLVEQGYNLFTFDYRGYGKSKGELSQKGVYEDALSALNKAREIHQEKGKGLFVVYGQSLGGVISLRALADYQNQSEVSLIVQDSTFDSYKDIAVDRLQTKWILYPFSPLGYVLVSDEYASDEVFDKIKSPTLVIVGQKDDVVPQKFGKRIYEGIHPRQKWLWKIKNGGHIDVFHIKNEPHWRTDFTFLLDQISQK